MSDNNRSKDTNKKVERCPNCGNAVYPGDTACGVCGATLEVEPVMQDGADVKCCGKCGSRLGANDTVCGVCGTPVTTDSSKTCVRCGSTIEPSDKFCKVCGAPAFEYDPFDYPPEGPTESNYRDGRQTDPFGYTENNTDPFGYDTPDPGRIVIDLTAITKPPVEEPVIELTGEQQKQRKTARLIFIVSVLLGAALGFVFWCTPYIAVFGKDAMLQNGPMMLSVMSGGVSPFGSAVKIEMYRFAGWTFFVYLICTVAWLACFFMFFKDTSKIKQRPLGLLVCGVLAIVAGTLVLIFGLISVKWLSDNTVSSGMYLGFVGVATCAILGGAGNIVAYCYALSTYPSPDKSKARGRRRNNQTMPLSVCLGALALALLSVLVPKAMGGGSYFAIRPEYSGYSTVGLTEMYSSRGGYYGGNFIELDGLKAGQSYTFTISLDMDVDADDMKDRIWLYHTADVYTNSLSKTLSSEAHIKTNHSAGRSTAKLTFSYDGEPLTIVVLFSSNYAISLGYDYTFSLDTSMIF